MLPSEIRVREQEKELAVCVCLEGVGGSQREVKRGERKRGGGVAEQEEERAEFSEREREERTPCRMHARQRQEDRQCATSGRESPTVCVFAPLFSLTNVSWQYCKAS